MYKQDIPLSIEVAEYYSSNNNERLNFESIINLPGLLFVKDINSCYLSITTEWANRLGWNSAYDSMFKTDYDIPCKVSEGAPLFIDRDKLVLSTNQKITTIEIFFTDQWNVFFVQKTPVKNKTNNTIGIMGQLIDVTYSGLFKWCALLNNSDKKIIHVTDKPISYILGPEHSPLPLTLRQQECLFLLVRGKSSKEIAYILNLSLRTIESHIETMKENLRCHSKTQLIEKAIDCGFFFYIPKTLLNNYTGLPT